MGTETTNAIITGHGDRTSFFKLFSDHDFRIVIPMLQREYAQGRDNVGEIRTEFLKALYDYLDSNKPYNDLDFIYGNISDGDFIPLDGQQRLTTLFLLNWYLSRITPDASLRRQFDNSLLDSQRSHCRFTYKTRTSSQEFCDALMLNDIDFKNLLTTRRDGESVFSVKATIEDCNWFSLSWEHDPTVMSMLNMLDAIHDMFKDRADFLQGLLDVDKPIITFLFMELEKYHLTDDLYIKMNSRGKALTDFENFKARYSEHIGNTLKCTGKRITRTRVFKDGTKLDMPLDRYFADRIDNKWTNMIWAYRNDGEESASTDLGLMCDRRMANLIRALLLFKYLELHPQIKAGTDNTFVMLANQTGTEPLSFISLREGDALSLQASEYLTDALDILSDDDGKPIDKISEPYRHCFSISDTMDKIMLSPREFNYNYRLLLYAYLGYIMRYGFDKALGPWMRVIFNLSNVDNHRIDSPSEISNAIKSVNSLLDKAPVILKYLAGGGKVDYFPTWLSEEERIKAGLITRPDDGDKWLDVIIKAERHGYFNGQIGFILEFSGIWDYYKSNRHVNWQSSESKWMEMFEKYSLDAQAVFADSYENRVNDNDYCFERAVLSKGDYLPSNNLHYNLLSTNTVKNNVKRDFTWKRLLRLDSDEDATERRGYVKAVFDDPAFDYRRPSESLNAVIADKPTGEQWRDTLINCPSAIEYCAQGFISFFDGIEGCEGILPMCSSRLSGYHKELYTWALYTELKNIPSGPFSLGIGYSEQKVNDILPSLFFNGFKFGRKSYWIDIVAETNPEDWSLSRLRLEFAHEGAKGTSAKQILLDEFLDKEGFVNSEAHGNLPVKYLKDADSLKCYLPSLFKKLESL